MMIRYLTIGLFILLLPGLLEDAIQCPRGKIIIPVTCDGHATLLDRVFVLAMTSSLGDQIPAVLPEHTHDITDFHGITKTPGKPGVSQGGALKSDPGL
jgi:hypothetical protein